MSDILEAKIETIHGDITKIKELDNWQSSAEVTKDRITDSDLRKEWLCTNNHALYDVEDGNAFLYFGSKNDSIFRADITNSIDRAFRQLKSRETNNYYKPPVNDVKKAKESSLRLKISDLELKFDNRCYSCGYIEIDTSDLTGESFRTDAQRKFAEAIYGSMTLDEQGKSDYSRAMEMLLNDSITKTRIHVFRKEIVLENAKDGAVARTCVIDHFNGNSDFYVDDNGGGCDLYSSGALRGYEKTY